MLPAVGFEPTTTQLAIPHGQSTGCQISLLRKMKELLLNNFVSNTKESATFSVNTGPDFGASCWICHCSTLEITLRIITNNLANDGLNFVNNFESIFYIFIWKVLLFLQNRKCIFWSYFKDYMLVSHVFIYFCNILPNIFFFKKMVDKRPILRWAG